MGSFYLTSNGVPRFVPSAKSLDEFVKIAKKTPEQFFDDHTLFPLLAVYHRQRKTVSPKPADSDISLTTLHFCSDCMITAVQSNGWAYIKRHWAVPGVRACLEHKKKLVDVASVYCGCYSLQSPKWFEDFMRGCCSKCRRNLWKKRQRQASDADLTFARIIHSLLTSNYEAYKSSNNTKIIKRDHYEDYAFSFRIRNVLHVLRCLERIQFLVYPDISKDIKHLEDIEERLIATIEYETVRRHGLDWQLNTRIGGMSIGDQPTDYEMTLDDDKTADYGIPSDIESKHVIDEHNEYIIDAHNRYLDSWIEKNGSIKPHLLAELCDKKLRAVAQAKLSGPLKKMLKDMEMLETLEYQFNKIVEKHTG